MTGEGSEEGHPPVGDRERAIKVYERCGFWIEGRVERNHYNYIIGEYGDDYQMAILLD